MHKDVKAQIFIPTFNRFESLGRAIESCLNQTFFEVEIVVLDNDSTDSTEVVVSELSASDARIKYHKNKKNIGMLGNFNLISKMVTAPYFCFLTDDDVYEKTFIMDALTLFRDDNDACAVVMNAPTRFGGHIIKSQLDSWSEGTYTPGKGLFHIINGAHPIITNCLFKKKFATNFIFKEEVGGAGDILILADLFANNKVIVSKKISGYYDLHESNASLTESGIIRVLQLIELKKNLQNYVETDRSRKIRINSVSIYELTMLLTLYDSLPNLKKNLTKLKQALSGKVGFGKLISLLSIPAIYYSIKWIGIKLRVFKRIGTNRNG